MGKSEDAADAALSFFVVSVLPSKVARNLAYLVLVGYLYEFCDQFWPHAIYMVKLTSVWTALLTGFYASCRCSPHISVSRGSEGAWHCQIDLAAVICDLPCRVFYLSENSESGLPTIAEMRNLVVLCWLSYFRFISTGQMLSALFLPREKEDFCSLLP